MMRQQTPADWQASFEYVKRVTLTALEQTFIEDIAFIGNASSVYEWTPAPLADIDVCMLCRELTNDAGLWLAGMRDHLARDLEQRGTDFEFRIIDGPYKLTTESSARPTVTLHAAVFTEVEYLSAP